MYCLNNCRMVNSQSIVLKNSRTLFYLVVTIIMPQYPDCTYPHLKSRHPNGQGLKQPLHSFRIAVFKEKPLQHCQQSI